MKKELSIFIILLLLFSGGQVWSQDEPERDLVKSTEEKKKLEAEEEALAKKSANPIANMISVPFQYNVQFGIGEYNRTAHVLNIMPI